MEYLKELEARKKELEAARHAFHYALTKEEVDKSILRIQKAEEALSKAIKQSKEVSGL